jgi:FMN-dependent oxidoreductase (nitrilotriacetate monooxygenase family)
MFPGTNSNTVWNDPRSGSYLDFDTYVQFAGNAEQAKFDFVFFAEGLRLREQNGRIYERDLATRPDNFTVLAALAAVTDRIGLTATINSTFNEPYEVARQFATLDHLCAGRAGWNVVTSWDRFVGENFRRGSFLRKEQRYERAELFLDAVMRIMASWRDGDLLVDKESGRFVADPDVGAFEHRDAQFDIAGHFGVPPGPQGRPVVFQAGTSDEGREFAAARADAIFGMYSPVEEKIAFYADVKGRLARYGRTNDSLLILPASTFAIGDTDAEAREVAMAVRHQQVDGRTAITFLESLWNRDLSAYDPDGPLPEVDPLLEGTRASELAGVRHYPDRIATAREWRELAEAKNYTIRELVIHIMGWQTFIGSPSTIADQMMSMVSAGACDGFIMVPHILPHALEQFTATVVPILQERGVFRSEYEGTTLRDHLGVSAAAASTR